MEPDSSVVGLLLFCVITNLQSWSPGVEGAGVGTGLRPLLLNPHYGVYTNQHKGQNPSPGHQCTTTCTPFCSTHCNSSLLLRDFFIPSLERSMDFTKKISETVCLLSGTVLGISEVGVDDNAAIGGRILYSLEDEMIKAAEVLIEYIKNLKALRAGGGHRVKRQVKGAASTALDSVGDMLVKSNEKIEADKKMLGSKAQNRINKKHREGIDKCGADSCKAAAKLLAASDDADDERQR